MILLIIIPFTGYSAVPQTINYQGFLTDSGGTPVDGTVQMTFSLYDVATGGSPLWTETQTSVTVSDGIYSVVLGSVTPINLAFDTQYYLGIEVETDGEMTPRQALTSVGYALNADRVDGKHASDFASAPHAHTETDPVFSSWDKSSGISITESEISDLDHFTTGDETDPTVNALGKATLSCSSRQIAKWNGSADTYGLAVIEQSREKIVVKELKKGKDNFRFNYYVTAIRSGFEEHKPVVANTHFKPEKDETAQEFEARFAKDDMTTKAMRSMLISNGVLTQDGKLNMAKVKELGWTVAEEDSSSEQELKAELIKR